MRTFAERRDLAITLCDLDVVETLNTARHRWTLLRHPALGRVLVMDDEIQHIENWQSLYHEPLVHLPAAFVETVENVLVLGGGSLFAAAEALRYPTVRSCVLVDHDVGVLELMTRHYPHAVEVVSDARFCAIEDDVRRYVESERAKYDLVINDSIDLINHQSVVTDPLYEAMQSLLSDDGVCADIVYRHIFSDDDASVSVQRLRKLGHLATSMVVVPEYPGVLHLMTVWGSPNVDQALRRPRNRVQQNWIRRKNSSLQFYNPAYLSFYLYTPPYLGKRLEKS